MIDYFKHQNGSVTVCDTEGVIIYMNDMSINTFGDKRGMNLFACHPPHAQEKIKQLLAPFIIFKNGILHPFILFGILIQREVMFFYSLVFAIFYNTLTANANPFPLS